MAFIGNENTELKQGLTKEILNELLSDGVIEIKGSGRRTYYELK